MCCKNDRITSIIALLLIFSFSLSACYIPLVTATEDSWTTKEPMLTARSRFGIAVVEDKIYAIGGRGAEGVLATNEEYDPASDTWTTKEPMPTLRCDFAIAVYDDKIYTFGGEYIQRNGDIIPAII
jgi:hypothetical protein